VLDSSKLTKAIDLDIQPETLFMLGRILNRCAGKEQKVLARHLMLSASTLGHAPATYKLIVSAMQKGALSPSTHSVLLQRLGVLAKKDTDPNAMALLGKVLLSQNKTPEALRWFQKATSTSLAFESAGEALVNQGRILLDNDKEQAREAFSRAALELDDPAGYFYLSKLCAPNSPEHLVYLLKAASSGIVEACHNLGALELADLEKKKMGVQPTAADDYGMAIEWFQLAAAQGFGMSMLNLAIVFKAIGQVEEGLRWLEKAETVAEVRNHAESVRAQWTKEKIILVSPVSL
jgi:TPR repeat protein